MIYFILYIRYNCHSNINPYKNKAYILYKPRQSQTIMFQTITKLYQMLSTSPVTSLVAPPGTDKGKYIYFGASIIYCDENNVCMVYYNPDDNKVIKPANTTMIVSSSS